MLVWDGKKKKALIFSDIQYMKVYLEYLSIF